MNHKRRRPKQQRNGCLFCKPHKGNGQPHKYHVKGQKGMTRGRVQKKEDLLDLSAEV